MKPKIDILREAMAAGDWRGAIALASKFPRLGAHKEPITRAAAAMLSPGFYRQLGMDPEALIAAGKAALIARYGATKFTGESGGTIGKRRTVITGIFSLTSERDETQAMPLLFRRAAM